MPSSGVQTCARSEEHTSELQSLTNLVCRLLLENKAKSVSDTEDQHVVAYLYDGPNVDKIKDLGIPVFKISGRYICYSPLLFLRLKRLITKIKPDLLHS